MNKENLYFLLFIVVLLSVIFGALSAEKAKPDICKCGVACECGEQSKCGHVGSPIRAQGSPLGRAPCSSMGRPFEITYANIVGKSGRRNLGCFFFTANIDGMKQKIARDGRIGAVD